MPERIVAVMARDAGPGAEVAALSAHASVITSAEELRSRLFDVLWIATSDRALEEVSRSIAEVRETWGGILVVHSSGATSLSALREFVRRGAGIAALHPNGSFTGEESIPPGLLWSVASDGVDDDLIDRLLAPMHPKLVKIDDGRRALYHAAASAAANYSVTLFAVAVELYVCSGLSDEDARDVVARFMHASVERSVAVGPQKAITGPIARGDFDVVRDQFQAVATFAPELLDLYRELARATARLFAEDPEGWERMFGEI
jgi:predicted short-subunit dehydrogenase-like oxidoreductase (DUF2520 family)